MFMDINYKNTNQTQTTKQHPYVGYRHSPKMKHHDMIALYLYGLRYRQIALQTGYSHSWVKHLFATNGKVREMIRGLSNKTAKDLPRDYEWMAGYKKVTDEEWLDCCTNKSQCVDDLNK